LIVVELQPVDRKGGAIFHAGPFVRQKKDGKYEMVSIGPTTRMRMEKFEKEFIKLQRQEKAHPGADRRADPAYQVRRRQRQPAGRVGAKRDT